MAETVTTILREGQRCKYIEIGIDNIRSKMLSIVEGGGMAVVIRGQISMSDCCRFMAMMKDRM